MNRVLVWIASINLFLFLIPSGAEGESPVLRIAVVDLEKVFEAHPNTAEATRELTESRAALTKRFKEQSNVLKKVLQEHQELIRAGNRSAAAEKLKEANEVERAIASLKTTQDRDLRELFLNEKTAILEDIRNAIAQWNEDEEYSMVLDCSPLSNPHGLSPVLHAPGVDDVTEEVIHELRKRAKP